MLLITDISFKISYHSFVFFSPIFCFRAHLDSSLINGILQKLKLIWGISYYNYLICLHYFPRVNDPWDTNHQRNPDPFSYYCVGTQVWESLQASSLSLI